MGAEHYNSITRFWAELESQGNLPLDTWGKQAHKSVIDLWKEVLHGDAQLEYKDGAWLRKLAHVEVMVFHPDGGILYQLFEERQVFHREGSIRQRLFPWVAEKIHAPRETFQQTFRRALREELGIMSAYEFVSQPHHRQVTQTSPSYPGLPSQYDIWQTQVVLSDQAYDPSGYIEVRNGKTTHFCWLQIPSFDECFTSSEQVRAVLEERGHIGQ